MHYKLSDDFCIIGSSWEETRSLQLRVIGILRRLGFFISLKKLISPATKIRFLGIDVHSVSLELTLPEDKLLKLRNILHEFLGRWKAMRQPIGETRWSPCPFC